MLISSNISSMNLHKIKTIRIQSHRNQKAIRYFLICLKDSLSNDADE